MKTVCLFCASMDGKDSNYIKEANKIGDILLKHNYSLLYGGGILGLMGVAAKSAKKKGVKIISIFPEYLDEPGIIFSKSQKVIKTKNILERKKKMIEFYLVVCLQYLKVESPYQSKFACMLLLTLMVLFAKLPALI